MAKIKKQTIENIFRKKDSLPKKYIEKKVIKKNIIEKKEEVVFGKRKERKIIKILILIINIVIILGLIGTSIYFYRQYKKVTIAQEMVTDNEAQAKEEAQIIKDELSTFMELPTDEDPIVATVTDIEKVKTQAFFSKAQNGDKVLIYTKNKKAILYRPGVKKIIEVSAISGLDESAMSVSDVKDSSNQDSETNLSTDEQIQVSVLVENEPVKVAVYNGSNIKELAQKIADTISQTAGIDVVIKTNAKGDFEKNLVIDLTGNHTDLVQQIAETVEGEVAELPVGEVKPDADILIIGGNKL